MAQDIITNNKQMKTNLLYTDFEKSITNMEEKLANMQNEIVQLNKKRKYLEAIYANDKNNKTAAAFDSLESARLSEKRESDKLTKQIEMLQAINRNISDDLDEWKSAFLEKANECETNREKYMAAQQLAEEYHRELDVTNLESSRSVQQTQQNLHLQVANDRLKDQLKEVSHLPFILETKQLELDEIQSKLKLSEKTIAALSSDLEACIVKCELMQKDIENEKESSTKLRREKENFNAEICEWKTKYDDLEKENGFLLKSVEKMKFLEECLDSKTKEAHEYCEETGAVKEECLKHVSRIKERTELQKRAFQSQISGLELEMVQLRTSLCLTHKDRDDMKQRMQTEISNLEQKFADSQLEIKNLKSHVDILKASYANMLEEFDNDDFDGDSDDYHADGNQANCHNADDSNNNTDYDEELKNFLDSVEQQQQQQQRE